MGWRRSHHEVHLSYRSNWLRAAVLGANDGILSVSSLLLGVAASGASRVAILTAGLAGLVAGASSMGAGEYVSVSSQRDTELADLRLEERELAEDPAGELRELTGIYRRRGLSPTLAAEVATALSNAGALEAHARDELGLNENDGRGRCKLPARRLSPSPAAPCCRWWRSRRPVTNIGCSPVLLSRSLRSPASATPVLVWAEHPESEPPFASWCGGRWQWQ